MGSLVAGLLHAAKHDVVLLGRPSRHVVAIREDGLRLVTQDGRSRRVRIPFSIRPWDVEDARCLIVLVKSWATRDALEPYADWLSPDTLVVTLQNGLGNREAIEAALPDHPRSSITVGVTSEAALFVKPGEVRHTGSGTTRIGVPPGGDRAAVEDLCAILTRAGMAAEVAKDIDAAIWGKLAVNAAINGITALAGVPNGEVAGNPALRETAERASREAATVARALGVNLDDPAPEMLAVSRATAENRSSMLRDIEHGRRTEVDAIQGEIVRRGLLAGIDTPVNQALAALVAARSGFPLAAGGTE